MHASKLLTIISVLLLLFPAPAFALSVDEGLADITKGTAVFALALQGDGRIVIGGEFTTIAGVERNHIARLNIDGSLDISFNPSTDYPVHSIAVQGDGKIVIAGWFTTVGGVPRQSLARLHVDGTLDTSFTLGPSFNPGEDDAFFATALQPDGRIIVGGDFIGVGVSGRNYIARLNADGSLDTSFNPQVNDGSVLTIALQEDGKVIIGGEFTSIEETTRNYIARLNSDGTLDAHFNPGANTWVYAVSVQPDGKILMGGEFTTLGVGSVRNHIARIHGDGTIDAEFNPDADQWVNSIALQSDGKILLGGAFTVIGSGTRNHVARLHADGALDGDFNHDVDHEVYAVSLQGDGRVLIGAYFLAADYPDSPHLTRLSTGDEAIQSLSVSPVGSSVTWKRSGAAPEVEWAVFEKSSSPDSWIPLGSGTRSADGWKLEGLALPGGETVRIRAHGVSRGGAQNGSLSVMLSERVFNLLAAPVATAAYPVTGSGFTATWEGVSGASGYLVGVSSDIAFTSFLPGFDGKDAGNVTSLSVAGLAPETTYYYRVRAYDGSGAARVSNVVAVTTLSAYYSVDLSFSGTGSGIVSSLPAGMNTNVNVSVPFVGGSAVTLKASASTFSLFGGWGGDCSGFGDCHLTMTSDRQVLATFTKDWDHSTYINRNEGIFKPTLQQAYDAAESGDIIQAWAIDFAEDVFCDTEKGVTLSGGYNEAYSSRIDATTLHGAMTIARGSIIIDRLVIAP